MKGKSSSGHRFLKQNYVLQLGVFDKDAPFLRLLRIICRDAGELPTIPKVLRVKKLFAFLPLFPNYGLRPSSKAKGPKWTFCVVTVADFTVLMPLTIKAPGPDRPQRRAGQERRRSLRRKDFVHHRDLLRRILGGSICHVCNRLWTEYSN